MSFRLLIQGGPDFFDSEKVNATLDSIKRKHGQIVLVDTSEPYGAEATAEAWAAVNGCGWERHHNLAAALKDKPDGACLFNLALGPCKAEAAIREAGVPVLEVGR